jgi:sugar lactone lactonase YvrE
LDGSGLHLVPGLDDKYRMIGWSPDGASLYVASRARERAAKVYKVSTVTGKIDLWRTFGADSGAAFSSVDTLYLSNDGSAYAYRYNQLTSQAYVVTGLK